MGATTSATLIALSTVSLLKKFLINSLIIINVADHGYFNHPTIITKSQTANIAMLLDDPSVV